MYKMTIVGIQWLRCPIFFIIIMLCDSSVNLFFLPMFFVVVLSKVLLY